MDLKHANSLGCNALGISQAPKGVIEKMTRKFPLIEINDWKTGEPSDPYDLNPYDR